MSTSPAKLTSLVAPLPQNNLSRLVREVNRTEKTQQEIIAALPLMTDVEVIETRWRARIYYRSAWKIEIACDAEIWDRQERALNGRGNVDTEKRGILAAVQKRAKEIGCGASTIYANARLYRRFENLLTSGNLLDDKKFYQAALLAEDPEAKIREWSIRKQENKFFRANEAWREVKKHAERIRPDETKITQTKEVKKFLGDYKASLQRLRKKVPESAIFLFELVDKHLADVHWQAKRTIEGDCRLIMGAIVETGGASDDEIYKWLYDRGYVMRNPQLDKRLELMVEKQMIIDESAGEEGKLSAARGKAQSWFVPYYVKRKRRELADSDDYGDEEHF